MIKRCTKHKNKDYHNYGGRKITVCNRWKNFLNFLEDMGESPSDCQIDRINNDQGYYPKNCRWATRKQQARNTRKNRLVTYKGVTKCVASWAEEIGIPPHRIYQRLDYGWSIERTLTTPVRFYGAQK